MKGFYITIEISNGEENETIRFLMEAETFEEACEKIKADLDVD